MKTITNNLITEHLDGTLFEVSTPLTMSLLGKDYPIHDDTGALYSLGEHEMSTYFNEHNDCIPYLINGNIHMIPACDYQFEVSGNEETAFLTVLLTFRLHANNEEDARNKLHNILTDDSNQLLDFSVFDINREQAYKTDILLYQISGLYKAKQLN